MAIRFTIFVDNKNLRKTLEGLKVRDPKVLRIIYKDHYPNVLGYIIQNGGSEDDAKDIFQETIMVVYKLLDAGDLDIQQDFGSYLIGIAKRLHLKQLRGRRIHARFVQQEKPDFLEEHPSDIELENERELNLIRNNIFKLGDECKKILMWAAQGMSNEEIASKMGYKSEKTVRTKKYKCKSILIEMIKNDPGY